MPLVATKGTGPLRARCARMKPRNQVGGKRRCGDGCAATAPDKIPAPRSVKLVVIAVRRLQIRRQRFLHFGEVGGSFLARAIHRFMRGFGGGIG